ncbi:hypothetical protein FHS85_001873 [Rhodoligotrophos appendicifer]|uniref:hypothetical protein n=1 Tax=Rhodoligotrophos appendicifer TaxID=987056 RepID=UPI00118679C4|nr:hypothetical protein [Rhodoligotrophos appendicifer]
MPTAMQNAHARLIARRIRDFCPVAKLDVTRIEEIIPIVCADEYVAVALFTGARREQLPDAELLAVMHNSPALTPYRLAN